MNRRAFFKGMAALALISNAVLTGVAKAKAACRTLTFGRVLNVPAEPVDGYSTVYRVHDGSVWSIEAIRDGGMELVIDGDEMTSFDLISADILPGHARTCLAEGMMRLGAWRVFPVTVDAIGANLKQRVTRMDELAGAVRDGSYSQDWRNEIDASGLLVHTWDSNATARTILNW